MQREIIRPNFERPVIVQLDHGADKALQREGQFGIDFEYTLNGNKSITWLPQEAHAQIQRMQLAAGEEIALQKIKRGRTTQWLIERVEEEPAPKPTPANTAAKQNSNAHTTQKNPVQAEAKESRYIMPAKVAELAGCLVAAAKAAKIAQEEAGVQLGAREIQALACTLYIETTKAGVR